MRRVLSAVLVTAALALAPAGADARSEKVVGWTAARVFPTAVRFLRVDEGVTIVEKDAEAGYVLFELSDEGKTFPGSLELATFERDGVERLRIVIHIEDRPEYMEVGMLDRLERKLRDQLGPAPKPAPKPAEPKPAEPAEPAPPPA
jgi:hypothetical protein